MKILQEYNGKCTPMCAFTAFYRKKPSVLEIKETPASTETPEGAPGNEGKKESQNKGATKETKEKKGGQQGGDEE